MSREQNSPRWASLDEAATHLNIHERTVRRLIADGTIAGYRFGKRLIRVDLNEIDAILRPIPSAQQAS